MKAKWGLVNESLNCSLFFSSFSLVRYWKKTRFTGWKNLTSIKDQSLIFFVFEKKERKIPVVFTIKLLLCRTSFNSLLFKEEFYTDYFHFRCNDYLRKYNFFMLDDLLDFFLVGFEELKRFYSLILFLAIFKTMSQGRSIIDIIQ